jgi:L-histidine Nalpha-methyltransferase
VQVAELGSGSGKKTRWILEALARRQRTYYYPIEISASALAACEKEMNQIDLVSVVGYERTYLDGLAGGGFASQRKGSSFGVVFGQQHRQF